TRHHKRAGVIVGLDQLPELRGAGDVGTLTDNDEIGEGIGAGAHAAAVNGSSPARRKRASNTGIFRGATPSTASLRWVMCSGVVPQQPPRMSTSPALAHSA